VFEWCAGPGFIGFSMLAHEQCETLCLADINPDAVAACRRTVAANKLEDRVTVYLSDNLKSIPKSEQWDLVVSNPPHFVDRYFGNLRAHDPDWRIHREFLSTVEPFLMPGAVIILQENSAGATVETFRGMIEGAGFKIVFVQGGYKELTADHRFFYIGIMRRDESVPAWAQPM
jgi:methylase of polypeptide subunit release factors